MPEFIDLMGWTSASDVWWSFVGAALVWNVFAGVFRK